ncbi:MAG: hypothetical protein ACM3JG_11025, partial [Thiohalocapsa sp.]
MSSAQGKRGLRLIGLPNASYLAVDKTAFPDDGRHEPTAPLPREIVLADGPMRLDPSRVAFAPTPPRPVERRLTWGSLGSLILHLLPLLAILDWPHAPPEISPP